VLIAGHGTPPLHWDKAVDINDTSRVLQVHISSRLGVGRMEFGVPLSKNQIAIEFATSVRTGLLG
jgi:hypothetical protein